MTARPASPRQAPFRLVGPLAICLALILGSLGGCSSSKLAPYKRPETPGKADWASSKGAWSRPASVSAAETISPEWWKGFGDATLDDLVSRAIAGSFEIKALAARIGVARAQIEEVRAGAQPVVNLSGGANFEQSTGQRLSTQFNLGAEANWEIDVWGKVEKGVKAQKAEFRASEADWRAGYLTLVADVATTYFQILQFDEQIDRQQKALAKNKQILTIYEAMVANGLAPQTQLRRQRAEINQLSRDLLEVERLRALAVNALATLVGTPAGEFTVPTAHLRERIKAPVVPAGLPSQLLERRPDIIAAEYRVLGSHHLIGQARLAELPSFSLTARGGTASTMLSTLLKSFTFGLAPSINFPAFDPRVKARVKTSEAEIKVAEAEYQRTVMAAFEEVENALVNLEAHQKQRNELEQQFEHLREVAEQVEAQLKEGLVSQLEVFESERSLLAAQQGLLANHQQILSDTVALYKALGGGWSKEQVTDAAE